MIGEQTKMFYRKLDNIAHILSDTKKLKKRQNAEKKMKKKK